MTETALPRLLPLPLSQWTPEAVEQLRGQLPRADRYLSDAPGTPELPAILGLLGNHPRLSSAWLGFNATLLEDTEIGARERELLILRVAWRTGCDYAWAEHHSLALRAGLRDDEVQAIRGDAEASTWTPRDKALLRAVDEMVDTHRISDATWKLLTPSHDQRQLLEILFVIGAYICLTLVMNSAGLRPEEV